MKDFFGRVKRKILSWIVNTHYYKSVKYVYADYVCKVRGVEIYRDNDFNLHRVDGPALIINRPDGKDSQWFLNGKLHREDGPAIELSNGYKFWYKHGQLHREDGPAVEFACGDKHWYKHSYRHRDDGPAVICNDGTEKWLRNDKPYTPTAHELMLWNLKKNQG